MTSPDMTATLAQIEAARVQDQDNIALVQAQLAQAQDAATVAGQHRAAAEAAVQQSITVDTSVGTRVYAGGTMIHSDTGWINCNHLLGEGWSGTLRLKRSGDIVYVHGYALLPGTGTTTTAANLPAGFTSPYRAPIPCLAADQWVYSRIITSLLQIEYRAPRPDVARDLRGSYRTSDPWPTVLPGIAA